MGEYMGTKEAGAKFGCNPSYVSALCRAGKIPGAEQDAPGSPWRIPSNAKNPLKRQKTKGTTT